MAWSAPCSIRQDPPHFPALRSCPPAISGPPAISKFLAASQQYSAVFQLGYPSSELKDSSNKSCAYDLFAILSAARPEVVYLHNPADKHDSHIAVLLRSIEALRMLPPDQRPTQVWGLRNLARTRLADRRRQDPPHHHRPPQSPSRHQRYLRFPNPRRQALRSRRDGPHPCQSHLLRFPFR